MIFKYQVYISSFGLFEMDAINNGESRNLWYAMRATYRRELIAKALLDQSDIENYIPMYRRTKMCGGRKKQVMVPAVHNLIFVHSTKEIIQEFKKNVPFLQYMMDKSKGPEVSPIIVPDKDMESFMKVIHVCQEDVEYMPVGDRCYPAGAHVRINGGQLDGVEGVLVRTGKSKDKKLVVTLNGVLSVAATISPSSVEVLCAEK